MTGIFNKYKIYLVLLPAIALIAASCNSKQVSQNPTIAGSNIENQDQNNLTNNTLSDSTTTVTPDDSSYQKIADLQKQVDDLKKQNNTVPTKTVTPKPVPIPTLIPESKSIPIQENFNEKSIISAKGTLAELKAFESGNNSIIDQIDKRKQIVNGLLSLENQSTSYSDETMLKIHNLFVNWFTTDLNTMNEYRNKFTNIKGFSTDAYPAINTLISTYPNKFISKEQSIADIQSLNAISSSLVTVNSKTNELVSSYYNYAINMDNQYKKSIQMYIDKLKEITGSYVPNNYYVPITTYIPPIQLPKVTNCYVQGYGNLATIDCYTR